MVIIAPIFGRYFASRPYNKGFWCQLHEKTARACIGQLFAVPRNKPIVTRNLASVINCLSVVGGSERTQNAVIYYQNELIIR